MRASVRVRVGRDDVVSATVSVRYRFLFLTSRSPFFLLLSETVILYLYNII